VADYNLGTARGKIEVQYDGAGVGKAQKGLQTFQNSAQKMASGFTKVAAITGAGAGLITAALAVSVNKAIDFEKQISAIGAVSGASAKEMDQLRQKALQLGADTAFSASESAQAMEELVKAGLTVEEVLNGAADATVNLAAAGGIDLPQAASIAANAMNVFNLAGKDMAHVADLIAGAANSSAIDVHDFGMSLAQSGAVANLVGLSFDDLSVAIALMGKAGVKGSDAGTSLKTMLLNLNPATQKQKELMKDLGIITEDGANKFFDAKGKLKSFGQVSQILQDALKGQTKAQQLATLETIFGSDAIRAAAVFTKEGAKGFDEMATAMGKVSAQDVAAKRLDNVAGAIEQLKGSLETAAIVIGTAFLPVIRKVAEFITMLANKFSSLDPRWQKLIAFGAAAAAALLGVIAALAAVGAVIAGVAASLVAVKIAAIIGAIVVAVGLLIAAFTALWKRSAAFRSAVQTAFGFIKTVVASAIEGFKRLVDFVRTQIIPIIQSGLKKAIDNLGPAFAAIKNWIETRALPAFNKLKDAFETARPTLEKIAKFIAGVLATSFEIMGKIIGTVVPIVLKLAGPVFSLLISAISFLIAHIPQIVSAFQTFLGIMKTIGTVLAAVVIVPLMAVWEAAKFVFNAIKAGAQALATAWSAIWATIGPPVMAVFNAIKAVVSTVMTAISAIIQVAWTLIKAVFMAGVEAVKATVGPAFNAIKAIITAVMGFLAPYLSAIWNTIRSAVSSAVSAVSSVVSTGWNIVKTVVTTVMNAVRSVVSSVWSAISGIVKGAIANIVSIANGVKAFVDKIRGFFNDLKKAAEGGTGSLIAFVKGIPGKILSAVGNLGGLLVNAGKSIIQGLINGISSMIGSLASKLSSITNLLPSWKGPEERDKKILTPSGQWIMEGLLRGIDKVIPMLRQKLGDVTALVSQPNVVEAALTTATAGAVRFGNTGPMVPTAPSKQTTIQQIVIRGVWDFTDPSAARKIIAMLAEEIDRYEREHK